MSARVELVHEIIDALNRGDIDAMLERMHPDFEWRPLEASPVARVYRGHEQVRRYVQDWLGTFESLRISVEEAEESAGRVLAIVSGHARGRVSGLPIDSRFCQVWTVRGEQALAMEEHATPGEARASCGLPAV